jgi:glycosyltransferase involved in cell wall biosynthesis
VEYHELLKLHEKAWALVFPSIWEEPLPYAVVEVMALGTIPIASRVGGVTELLNDTIAQQFMVSPSSINDLVKKISTMLSLNTDELKVLGFKLRSEILRKLDLDKIERRIIEVFEEGY